MVVEPQAAHGNPGRRGGIGSIVTSTFSAAALPRRGHGRRLPVGGGFFNSGASAAISKGIDA
jgi:hypothetical protein